MNIADKKFNIIYADPPWQYRRTSVQGAAENHYPTMSFQQICALSVDKLAAPDCTLFLWVTFPILNEVFDVIRAWGFTYKTVAFCWVKQNPKSGGWAFGLGNWTRANAEICLLATKGNPKRATADVPQLIVAPREEHSKKPDETRERIVRLLGDLPRVELFARQAPLGWDVWGNEVQSTISL